MHVLSSQNLLAEHGRFPEKHRCLVWRFLLRLPDNADSYADLVRKGAHASYADLPTRLPMRSARGVQRLVRCVSALAHWSPVFGELKFIPGFVFPFSKLFGQ